MNRFNKEQLRQYLFEHIGTLTEAQRREFVYKFGRQRGSEAKNIINRIDNKLLRRAHKYVLESIKDGN